MGGYPFPPPQQIAAMMNSPVVRNTIQQMLQNPDLIRTLLANNPLAQQLATNPQVAAALQNPDLYQQLSDPQTLQTVAQMYNNMFGGMAGLGPMGFGGMGGFPQQQPGAPTTGSSTQNTTPSTTSPGTGGAVPNLFAGIPLDPLINNLQQQQGSTTSAPATTTTSTPPSTGTTTGQQPSQPTTSVPSQPVPGQPTSVPGQPAAVPGQPGANPWAAFFPGFGFPMNMPGNVPQQPVVQDPEQRFAVQLQQLNEMGFTNRQLNIQCLTVSNGNVDLAIERMLNG
jgi:ubiquilin